jgi:hypothetical protein
VRQCSSVSSAEAGPPFSQSFNLTLSAPNLLVQLSPGQPN